jgi:hypothetical protein
VSYDLVTFDEAVLHLHLDGTVDSNGDAGLELMITSASRMVLNHLKDGADDYLDSDGQVLEDSNGDPDVPAEVKHATLFLLGYLWRKRDEDEAGEFAGGRLPAPVRAILGPLRDPALK